jgi:hypothetical protein
LIVDAWTGLSIAVNEIDRSMGLPDHQPFVPESGNPGTQAPALQSRGLSRTEFC